LARHFAAIGVAPDLLDNCLCSGTAGASRNVLLLLSAGEHLLMIDDDMRWTTWRAPDGGPRLAFGGHDDPRITRFFSSRKDAVQAVAARSADLLSLHDAVLGTTARQLLVDDIDLTTTCSHLLHAICGGDTSPTIRVSMMGVAGDAGIYCPYQFLLGDAAARAVALRSNDMCRLALTSREMHRVAPATVVTHDPRCMAGCMALTNELLLPPFMPLGTNEDGIFGAALAACDADSLFAHLPWGVIHDSPRPAFRSPSGIPSVNQTRLADLTLPVIRLLHLQIAAAPSCALRLRHLSDIFTEIGTLGSSAFRATLRRILTSERCRQIDQFEALSTSSTAPYWKAAADDFRIAAVHTLTQPDFLCPIELQSYGSVEGCEAATQRFFQAFGEWLHIWPDIWQHARDMTVEERTTWYRPSETAYGDNHDLA
jgi:hypothetical protein